jgi:L-threonylcarbamoyladenylate synthase
MAKRVALSTETVREAATVLRDGGLVILPIGTVYVITADATRDDAVNAVYRVKDRPRMNPFMVLVHSLDAARKFAQIDGMAAQLAERFWPGPLTLGVPLRKDHSISHKALLKTADSIAVCVPNAPEILPLLEAVGRPLICSSANPSGHLTPTDPGSIVDAIADAVDMVLEDGPTPLGIETTIVATQWGEPMLVRPGGTHRDEIEAVIGRRLSQFPRTEQVVELLRHKHIAACQLLPKYNVGVPLRLNAQQAQAGELFLGFGKMAGADLNLSETGDLREAARNLYSHLGRLAHKGPHGIAVAPVPTSGLGEAINHRLQMCARASEHTF